MRRVEIIYSEPSLEWKVSEVQQGQMKQEIKPIKKITKNVFMTLTPSTSILDSGL